MLLRAWLDSWLSLYIVPTVRPSTAAGYRRSVEALPPDLAELVVEELNASALLALRAWQLKRAARFPRAAQLDRVMLSRALTKAQALGLAPSALAVSEALPPITHHAAKAAVLTAQQLRAYMDEAPFAGGPEGPLLLLCCCGLRRGEALGARWVDLSGNVFHVAGSRDAFGVYGPPKSAHSDRKIILPAEVVEALRACPVSLRSPWIVDTTASRLDKAHRRTLAACGLSGSGVTLHGLRHTFATLAAEGGASMKLLQVCLGHSTVGLTSDLYADHLQGASPLPFNILSALPAHDWKSCYG